MQTWQAVRDIVVTLGVALVFGVVAQRARQSPVIGYLLAGLAIGGPGSLGLVDHVPVIEGIAELGAALLLFTIGLDFSYTRLRRFGRVALVGGACQIALTTIVVALAAAGFGAGATTALVAGMVVSLSSTAVVVRVLTDSAQLDSTVGSTVVAVLLLQDIVVIPYLVLAQDAGHSVGGVDVGTAFLVALAKVVALAAGMYVLDYLLVARAFERIGGVAEREELLVLLIVVLALGAAWTTHELGLSAALGAFVAGLVVAGAPYADHVRAEIGPLRVLLVTLFFAAIGMLADIRYVVDHIGVVLGLAVALVAVKTMSGAVALRVSGVSLGVAVVSGVALAQIGEFSFVIAATARDAGAIDGGEFQRIVSVSLVTLLATPPLIAASRRIAARYGLQVGLADRRSMPSAHHVVVGFGPAGQRVVERLRERTPDITVIELNPRLGDDAGVRVVHGDAGKLAILRRAEVHAAATVTITIPDPMRAQGIARSVRAIAPEATIVVRGRYNRTLSQLRATGADVVVDEETETGERLADATLRAIGASSVRG